MQPRKEVVTHAEVEDGAPPIDRAHLARQTLGDSALEAEVLSMFLGQVDEAQAALGRAGEAERARIAHALVGSARGIGAFALADCAAAIERRADDAEAVRCFAVLAEEVRTFVAALRA